MSEQLTNSLGSVYLTIEYDEKQKWAHCAWRGFIRLPEIQEGFDAIINFLEEKECYVLFSDHSGIVGPWNEGNEWLFNDWQPRAIEKGLRYWAINTGDDLFSNISLELFLTKEQSKDYMVKVFEDNQSAKDWLKETVSKDPLEARKQLGGKKKTTLPPKKQSPKAESEPKEKPAAKKTEKKPEPPKNKPADKSEPTPKKEKSKNPKKTNAKK